MAWQVSSGPASEPLTTSQVKDWLKVDTSADDGLIAGLITAGRKHIERQTGIAMITQTVVETFDAWPETSQQRKHDVLRLSVSPVQSITSVKYKADNDGTLTTWDSANYVADLRSYPARIGRAFNASWPTLYNELDAVQVTYVAGHTATTDANFPSELLTALYLWIAGNYENREDRAKQFMNASEAIMQAVKVRWLHHE